MRILFVYPTLFTELAGGLEVRNLELAAALARRGHRVTLAARTSSDAATLPPGVDLARLGPFRTVYNASGRRSTRAALGYSLDVARLDLADFDVIETASVPHAHLPVLAARCRLAGRPLLVSWYEYWGRYWRTYLGTPQWPLYAFAEWSVARLGRAALASSELTLQRLARRRRGLPSRLLHCGIRLRDVQAAASRATPGPPLVYAGRLLREKRLDLLISALTRLPPSSTPLLTVIGDGPDRERLERHAGQLGLADRVVFRGRLPEHEEVWRELGGARIAVQPSAREGFGLFPLEAMAVGLPVVHCLSSESAVSELVRQDREGVGIAPDVDALAATLSGLLGNPDRCRMLGSAGTLRAAAFDWDVVAEEFEAVAAAELAARRA